MEVSTFELLYKQQAPAPNVERVVQGYFLSIANLEKQAYRYKVEFFVFPPPLSTPDQAFRSPAGNTLTFVDTGGTDNAPGTLVGTLASKRFTLSSGLIEVPAGGTALLAVLPSIFPSPLDPTPVANPVLEIRGYVRISLPAVRTPPSIKTKPQSKSSVRVLLTPQQRATFFNASNQITNQVQATLPVASGGALNSIPPDPFFGIVVGEFDPDDVSVVLERFQSIEDSDRFALLLSLLAQVDDDNAKLRSLNKILVETDIPLALSKVDHKPT